MNGRRPRLTRRGFLRAGLAAGAGLALGPAPSRWASALPGFASAELIPDPADLVEQAGRFEAVLAPAYAAADLIRRGLVRPLAGPPGRPHDPAGAFTLPAGPAVLAIVYTVTPPARPSLEDAFCSDALWPAAGRLALSLALLRRGFWPDDPHPGRWARAERDLAEAHPRLVADPLAALAAGRGRVALAWVDPAAPPAGAHFPADGYVAVELDWLIPRAARRPPAEKTLAQQRFSAAPLPAGAYTLGPWPAAAQTRFRELWSRLHSALTSNL